MIKLKILGPGCSNCRLLAEKVERAAQELSLEYEMEKVEDMATILSYGVMMTPGLVVDGEVKLTGRVPHIDRIKEILAEL
jgi:small redox-active disulfide protein 2